MPPAADAFWSEDSAALHDAVQAPATIASEHLEPPVGLVPPVAGRRTPALPRLPRPNLRLGAGRLSPRWALAVVTIIALLVIAAIGAGQGPTSHPAAAPDPASSAGAAVHHPAAAANAALQTASTSKTLRGSSAKHGAAKHVTKRRHAGARTRPRVHSRASARGAGAHAARVEGTASHSADSDTSSGSAPPTITEAAAPPPPTDSSTPTTAASSSSPAQSAGSTASTGDAKSSKPAAGPTGIGSVSNGCNPKCS